METELSFETQSMLWSIGNEVARFAMILIEQQLDHQARQLELSDEEMLFLYEITLDCLLGENELDPSEWDD